MEDFEIQVSKFIPNEKIQEIHQVESNNKTITMEIYPE